jgi:Phosphoglucose isomerase
MAGKSERNRKMTTPVKSVSSRVAWKALEAHHWTMREWHLRKLFAEDPKRGERFTIEAADIYLDYSKNRITDETIKLLFQLAEECGLRARIDAMFRGGSFQTKMFGWKGKLTPEQIAEIAATKQVIYDGFKTAVIAGVPKRRLAF